MVCGREYKIKITIDIRRFETFEILNYEFLDQHILNCVLMKILEISNIIR